MSAARPCADCPHAEDDHSMTGDRCLRKDCKCPGFRYDPVAGARSTPCASCSKRFDNTGLLSGGAWICGACMADAYRVEGLPRDPEAPGRACSVDGCERERIDNSVFCPSHHDWWTKEGVHQIGAPTAGTRECTCTPAVGKHQCYCPLWVYEPTVGSRTAAEGLAEEAQRYIHENMPGCGQRPLGAIELRDHLVAFARRALAAAQK